MHIWKLDTQEITSRVNYKDHKILSLKLWLVALQKCPYLDNCDVTAKIQHTAAWSLAIYQHFQLFCCETVSAMTFEIHPRDLRGLLSNVQASGVNNRDVIYVRFLLF